MDKAQELVRMVARAFYEPEAVVIIDALIRHICLNISDLSFIFSGAMRHKDALKAQVGLLKMSGLLREFTRQEMKQGAQKATLVTYYYIDYRHAVDATKYRLHTATAKLRKEAGPQEEKKEYRCLRCKGEFTEIEVMDRSSADGSTFICPNCGNNLQYIEQDSGDAEQTGPVGQFNKALEWLIRLMKEIDHVSVPAVTSEDAMALRDEPPRPPPQLNAHSKIDVPSSQVSRPVAVKGIATGPAKIEVSITSDADNTAAAQVAAAEQKQRLAAQNVLPEWHTHSTISNEVTAVGQREEAARREREAEMGLLSAGVEDEKKDVKADDLEDIFAQIEAEQAQERLKQEEEEDEFEDEDEEEDEFEDVAVNGGVNGSGHAIENGNGVEQPDAKRAKLEVDTPVSQATPASGDADDDEEEFEDV